MHWCYSALVSASFRSTASQADVRRSLPTTQIVLLGTGTPGWDPDRSGPATAIVVNGTPYLIQSHCPRACAAQGKGDSQGSRFPETATTSLGVLQPWPLPSSRLVSPEMAAGMITSPHSAPLAGLLQRVRDEYREMPELKLTKPQATRLFGVAPSVCAAVLRALVMENFLSRTGEGEFVRSTT